MNLTTKLTLGVFGIILLSCGKKTPGGSDGSGAGNPENKLPSSPSSSRPSGNFDPSKTMLDLRGALGFAKLGGSTVGQGLLLSADEPFNLGDGSENKASVAKVTKNREIKNIFVNKDGSEYANTYGRPPEIYKAPTGEVYVFFPDGIYDTSKSGLTCQIFKASGNLNELTREDASPDVLECLVWLENKRIESVNWGVQGAQPTLQFDGQGRIILRIWSNQAAANAEIVRINPADASMKLLVNSNIMVGKFFSTPNGGLYYTANVNGTNVFRYVDKNGALQQIAESTAGPTLFFPVPNDPNDKVIYVGPHPSKSAGLSGWVQPEILTFTPSLGSAEDEDRILVQVGNPVTSGLYLGSNPQIGPNGEAKPNAAVFRASCESGGVDYTYSNNLSYGSIIPEKNGDYLFVNSNGSAMADINYYAPGKVVCYTGSPYQVGAACDSVAQVDWLRCVDSSVPSSNETEIQSAYNSSSSRLPLKTPILRLTAAGALNPVPFPSDVQVKKIWKIGSDFFYLQSKNSVFSLKKWVDGTPTNGELGDRTLKFKFEIYSLAKSGSNELMFSGLDFNTNEYGMGYINLGTLQAEMKENVRSKVSDFVTLDD
ncbi:MAG: hypothetical protein RLZZ488_2210 [Pseudomonadota bacterium]|jgi:hypothetical protein